MILLTPSNSCILVLEEVDKWTDKCTPLVLHTLSTRHKCNIDTMTIPKMTKFRTDEQICTQRLLDVN